MSSYIGKHDYFPTLKTVTPLHIAKSLQELEKRGTELVQSYLVKSLRNELKLWRVMTSLSQIEASIAEAERCNDQELIYLSMFKYVSLYSKHRDCNDYKALKQNTEFSKRIKEMDKKALNFMDKLQSLKKPLEERYSKTFLVPADTPKKADCEVENLNEKQTNICNGQSTDSVSKEDLPVDGSMHCSGLYNLWLNEKNSIFVVDVRPAEDFKQSRIPTLNQMNIPPEIIKEGLSAESLAEKMDPVNRAMWNKRGTFEQVVLVDSCSKVSSLDPKSPVAILKNIMDKWDLKTKYKSTVRILDGGLEEFFWTYPFVVVNFKFKTQRPIVKPIPDELDNLEYPIYALETEKELQPAKPSHDATVLAFPSPPHLTSLDSRVSNIDIYSTVDRSKKPKFSERQTGSEQSNETLQQDTPMDVDVRPTSSRPASSVSSPSNQTESREVERPENDNWALAAGDKTYLENLRRRKPTGSVSNYWDIDSSSSDEECSPLKKDSNSNLKRSFSSPNLAKLDDFEPAKPSFSRSDKPTYSQKAHNMTMMYGDQYGAISGKTIPGLTGLKNFANNCYMNAILQCLSNTEEFKNELLTLVNSPVMNKQSKTHGNIVKQVTESVRYMWSGDFKALTLRGLKDEISGYKEIFKGAQHQDCHEFLIILLEYLHDDLNTVGAAEVGCLVGASNETGEHAWGEFRSKNTSIIQRLFYGQDRSTVTCSVCRHESVTFGQFFNLFVPIPDNTSRVSLDDCLRLYTSEEKITGWTCPQCKCNRIANKKMDISKLPPILIIALKRFTQEGVGWGRAGLEKKDTPVSYPLEGLDMTHYTSANSEQRFHRYDLYALSLHTGSLRGGHYYAICKSSHTHKWHKYDDTSVATVSPSEAKDNCDVYILFYRAVN